MVRGWLVSLPHDLKIAFDAMDDENLPRNARELAVGTIIYIVSPNDSVSDRNDTVVSFTDDAVLLRLGLRKVVELGEKMAPPSASATRSSSMASTSRWSCAPP